MTNKSSKCHSPQVYWRESGRTKLLLVKLHLNELMQCRWLLLISRKSLCCPVGTEASSYQDSLVLGLTEGDCHKTVLLSHSYSCGRWNRGHLAVSNAQDLWNQELIQRGAAAAEIHARLMDWQFDRYIVGDSCCLTVAAFPSVLTIWAWTRVCVCVCVLSYAPWMMW